MRDEGRNAPEIKAHREVWPQGESREGEGGGGIRVLLLNNLVYTKRRKDIYANRKHETTSALVNLNPGHQILYNIFAFIL